MQRVTKKDAFSSAMISAQHILESRSDSDSDAPNMKAFLEEQDHIGKQEARPKLKESQSMDAIYETPILGARHQHLRRSQSS